MFSSLVDDLFVRPFVQHMVYDIVLLIPCIYMYTHTHTYIYIYIYNVLRCYTIFLVITILTWFKFRLLQLSNKYVKL